MSQYLKKIFRLTDDFDSFSFGESTRFNCVSKKELAGRIVSPASPSISLALESLTENPHLLLAQVGTEATLTIEFVSTLETPVTIPNMVIPITGVFVMQPLYTDRKITKVTLSTSALVSQNAYIGAFYAGV